MQKFNSFRAITNALAISGVLFFLLGSSAVPAFAQSQELPERPETQQLLPETTVGMLKLRNFSEFVEKMKNSSSGQMFQSESVAPLVNSFYDNAVKQYDNCLLYTSPSPRDRQKSRMPSSA